VAGESIVIITERVSLPLIFSLTLVAAITPGRQVCEDHSQLRVYFDGDHMIRVEVSVAAMVGSFQIIDDLLCRRWIQASFAEESNDVRLPATVDAAPVIPEEANDSNSFMIFSVTALDRCSSKRLRIVVLLATARGGQLSAAILPAWFER